MSTRTARTFCLALAGVVLGTVPPPAHAFNVVKAPITSVVTSSDGAYYGWCQGSIGPPMMTEPLPLEWEIRLENDDPTGAITLTYDDIVNDGLNGDRFTLDCPPTLLPSSVDPIRDVTCDPVANRIVVRNISVEPCTREVLRFQVYVNTEDLPPGTILCNGGTGSSSTTSQRSVSALPAPPPPPVPSDPDDTCILYDPPCASATRNNVRLLESAFDVNGPPLLPGDLVRVRAWMDLTYMEAIAGVKLNRFMFHALDSSTLGPLPVNLDFLAWTDTSLPDATYEWDPAARTVRVFDLDPVVLPDVTVPGLAITTIGEWEGQVRCGAPSGVAMCMNGVLRSRGSSFFESDDALTLGARPDDTCLIPIVPVLSGTKSVTDGDRSGTAQPGELLTFRVNVRNTAVCPAGAMACECAATGLEVVDFLDTTRLEEITVLDGGVLRAPDEVEWTLDAVDGGGAARTVSFQARVRRDVRGGDTICNTAEVTAAELRNVADGGKSNCPSAAPTRMSLSPCLPVTIPVEPFLLVDKDISAPLGPPPYAVGTEIEFAITVSNVGAAAATSVDVWDCLDTLWDDPLLVTPLDLGVYRGGADPGCGGRGWVRWPTIPSLPPAGSRVQRFRVRIARGLPDGVAIYNIAESNAVDPVRRIASSRLTIPVCAPALSFTKTLPASLYREGDRVEWTVTVANTGGCAATGIVITDAIDLAQLEDAPILTWTDPPGGASSYAGGVITWTLPSLDAAASASFTVSSVLRPGAAPGPVCNSARMSWEEGLTEMISDPPGGEHCADVEPGGACGALGVIRPVHALKAPTRSDVRLDWPSLAGSDGYRACRIDGFASRAEIPLACEDTALAISICDPVAVGSCDDLTTAATSRLLYYYQVKGLCGGIEGP